jgi:magnesium transporter
VTDHLIRTPSPLIAGDVEMYLSDVRDHLERTLDEIDLCRDTINSARELYLSIISNRTNEVMRVLAVVSTIVLPLTLIASIYGMNVGLPGGGEPSRGYGESFWVILMVMAGLALLMVGIFRHKKWL